MGERIDNNVDDLEEAYNSILTIEYQLYKHLRHRLIEEGYMPILHSDHRAIMEILEYCLRYFADQFEQWCMDNLKNPHDIGTIIALYSSYERGKNCGELELCSLDIIGLYVCRYILSIAPNLQLSTKGIRIFKDNNIYLPELFALANCIGNIIQFRTVEGLSRTTGLTIDLTSNFVRIDYVNADLENLLQKSRINGEKILDL